MFLFPLCLVLRTELLKLLLTCFSEAMYLSPSSSDSKNPWVSFFCSTDDRYPGREITRNTLDVNAVKGFKMGEGWRTVWSLSLWALIYKTQI